VITVAVCWYPRYGLSYRDVEELLSERGIQADHVTVCRWVHLYRALDQHGQIIDVLISQKRDLAATRQFFTQALQRTSTR
jgi:transposase-like protein